MKTKKLFLAIAALLMTSMGAKAQTTVASWIEGTADGGTWTSIGNAFWLDASKDNAQVTQKYNSNKTTVNVITFTSNISFKDGEFNNAIKLEGDFKKGDVVTLQPFTNMSTADFTGSGNADGIPTKYANIVIKDAANTELFTTGGTATEKTVTDGHEEAGDPKTFSYTLADNQSVLYFGRVGNTRINVIEIVVVRPESSVSVEVGSSLYATFANTTGGTLTVPAGLTAYGVASVDGGKAVFAEYNVIPDGVGVILKADAATTYTLEQTDEACEYTGANLLVAVTEDQTVPAKKSGNINYIFANKSQGVGFYKSSGTGTVSKGKAYLSIVDTEADNRSWTFTSFSDATKADLEAERTGAAEKWAEGAKKTVDEVDVYRYKNVGALANTELTANGNVIAETAGLLFTAKDGKLGIDCRSAATQVFLDGTNSTITIADLKAGHTVTITARTSSSSAAAYMTCTDETNVERTGDTESTAVVDNVFTINANGTYTFAPNRAINVHSIKIAPADGGAAARDFFAIDGQTTGISAARQAQADGHVYDLQGRRVSQPRSGLYIVNGKKYIVR